jgi:two-component system KDP operon response regulator KdpE
MFHPYNSGMAILHVEDQAVIRDVVRRALEARGFTVVSADGVAAAKLLVTERADLVGALLDVRLRDGNGVELYEWIIMQNPRLAACVAFVTGSADADARGALERLGRPILGKPFEIADLWDLATEWERAGARRTAASDYQERRVDA